MHSIQVPIEVISTVRPLDLEAFLWQIHDNCELRVLYILRELSILKEPLQPLGVK